MPKVFTSHKQKIGKLGEQAAEMFLVKHGFVILETNYCSKYGEIDIVAQNVSHGTLHFVEVKSATFDSTVSHETVAIRPEENMTYDKIKKLHRTIAIYLSEKKLKQANWQLDLYVVYLDQVKKSARLRKIENVVR